MNNLFLLLITGIFLCGCNTTPTKTSSPISPNQIEKTERDGMALYKAMLSSDATDDPTSRESDLLSMASKEMLCKGEYQAVRIQDTKANLERIYLVLQPSKSAGIQVGRHIRFDFKLGTNDLDGITLSTKSCLLIPNSVENSVAAFVTHLLSPIPSEFHVYLSLLHGKPLYVSTELGMWVIENGKISRSEA